MEVKMHIEGLKEMEKNLLALGADLGARTLRSALRDSAKPLEDSMIASVPVYKEPHKVKIKGERVTVDPGFLKSKIKRRASYNKRGRVTKKFGKNDVAVVQVGAFGVPYVVQVEFGSKRNKAASFIRGAASQTPRVINLFKTRLKRRTDLAVKRLARQKK
jgi:HK97 gp10 family phage protein